MLQLPNNINLSSRSSGYLARWQNDIDSEPTYEDQISKAKSSWGKSNRTFDEIKEKLRLMSNSTKRCNYCEDSYADEIEHIYPKNIYPDRAFVWANYLYACGSCNGPKSNKFALIDGSGNLNDITPPRRPPPGYVYTPPPANQIALIDPRVENPFDYLELDITFTFRFIPNTSAPPADVLRAQYTIEVLRLNDREYLVEARKHAFINFRARLREFIQQRDAGAPPGELDTLTTGIKSINHQTVWHEMKRFRAYIPVLDQLFIQAPEALRW